MITEVKKMWSEENPNSDYPVYTYADQLNKKNITRENDGYSSADGNSSRFYEKGDYLALRELTLNYNLPKTWMSPLGISAASVYITGQNLFYITKYSGASPEVVYGGLDAGRYPTPKTLLFGVSVTF